MTEIYGAPTLHDALVLLAQRVRESEDAGKENLIFCEDRLTLLAERAVIDATGGTMKTEVTTFARFLQGEEKILSKQGSVMALSALIVQCGSELKCFQKGAAQVVYETIAQLSASRVGEEELLAAAGECDGILSLKLQDLALLLKKYREFLCGRGLLDENGYLALLPDRIAGVRGKRIFFFGFPSFTRQALEGVRAAIGNASVTGIFVAGRESFFTNEAAHRFRMLAEELGPSQTRLNRSTLEGDALALSQTILSPDAFTHSPQRAEHIHMFRPADEAEEIETVCALIRRHVIEDGMRYRDFALLLPSEERLLGAESIFAAYGIPCYADRKRPLSEHPFALFVNAALACVHDGCRPESVDAFLASIYFGAGDVYRNYLLKYGGYRGGVRRAVKDVTGYDREELSKAQARALQMLSLFPREGRGAVYCDGVRELFALSDGENVTLALSGGASPEMQKFLQTDKLFSVLNEIGQTVGGEKFTAFEFMELFKSALSALKISMIPQRGDVVFVGDITESKFDRVKVLFCAGLDDSVPRTGEDTAVITDGEIGRLKTLSVEIEPAIAVVNARAREAAALNVCSFTEELYLSCPKTVNDEEARPGELFSGAAHLFVPAPLPDLFPYLCSRPLPAACKIAQLSGEGSAEEFSALYEALMRTGQTGLARIRQGYARENVRRAEELYFSDVVSPTMLESYFACPYAGFVKGLRLREREERPVLDTDTGTFVHAVLEEVAPRFSEFTQESEAREAAESCARGMLSRPRYAPLSDTDAGVYTGERLVRECGKVTEAAYRQLACSKFRIRDTELSVSLPALGIGGRLDRVDESDEYVRIIDYKTGTIDDKAASYYMGLKLQLQLYMLAASEGKKPAGAFYFPAAEDFTAEDEVKYRMSGFYSNDGEVTARMDTVRTGGASEFYCGGDKSTSNGLAQEDFEDFLAYAALVSEGAREEMKAGYIQPSPEKTACRFCKFKGMCGFAGVPRERESVSCAKIAEIVRKARGENE